MQIPRINTTNSAILGIYRLLTIFFFLFVFYFAQAIVIPIVVAALLTFLISPLVTRLEKWIGRIPSICLVVISVFSIIGMAGYIFTQQLVQFGSNLPNYSERVQKKLYNFQFLEGKAFSQIEQAFSNLQEALFGEPKQFDANPAKASPIEEKIIDLGIDFTKLAGSLFGSLFNVFANSTIVILLVIFMLLNREDLRGRLIKLIGNKISSTTSALEDASKRVYTYLSRLLIVNIGGGIVVIIGLSFLGIPNAILWGCFIAIMSFIPYIGFWIAAITPIILSFIIADTWLLPTLTISFFVLIATIIPNFIEPVFYGLGTGVSSFALILATIFWTWFWGPLGLLLSIPLTVCLVVLGQHVPHMNFLSVLLSQEQALTPAEECYHRLLTFDVNESMDLLESYLKNNSLVSLYDSVLIPVISQAQIDFSQELIDTRKKDSVFQSMQEIVEFLSANEQKEATLNQIKGAVLCLPARTIRDELGATILTQLLTYDSFAAHYSAKYTITEIFDLIEKKRPDLICIAAVAPFILSHVRYLCAKLHQHNPQLPILISLLGLSEIPPANLERLTSAGATNIAFSLAQTLETVQSSKQAG